MTGTKELVAGTREVTTIAGVAVAWRFIPAGAYTMGSPPDELGRFDDEAQRIVTIAKPFWLMETPVTQALYEAVTGNNPSHFTGDPRRPVETVSWYGATNFAERVGARLAAEEEWEYACRAGTTGPRYGDLYPIAWNDGNSEGTTHPVATKAPNAWGLRDMLGNVWEWTASASGESRVVRGGSWDNFARGVRAACRLAYHPGDRYDSLGFRLARGLAPSRGAEPSRIPHERSAEPARDAGDDWRVW